MENDVVFIEEKHSNPVAHNELRITYLSLDFEDPLLRMCLSANDDTHSLTFHLFLLLRLDVSVLHQDSFPSSCFSFFRVSHGTALREIWNTVVSVLMCFRELCSFPITLTFNPLTSTHTNIMLRSRWRSAVQWVV